MDNNKGLILVLGVNSYDFISKETNDRIVGRSMFFASPDVQDGYRGKFGHQITKVSLNDKVKFAEVPGYYKALFRENYSSTGVNLILDDIEFIKPAKLF